MYNVVMISSKSFKYLFLFFSSLYPGLLFSQADWRLCIGDEWFNKFGSKGLRVGDSFPDIPLGKVLNNKTNKVRFSDFNNKLVILDFWNTHCSSCIAAFPKMEELQRHFGNKIQIILVNPIETEDQIQVVRLRGNRENFIMPDLPCIVAEPNNSANQLKNQ